MTALEFLYRLNTLSPKSRLTIAHLGAVFEMLTPVLSLEAAPVKQTSLNERLTNENAFAASIGASISTVQNWRAETIPAQSIKYLLGPVMDWIKTHIIPMFSESPPKGKAEDLKFSDIALIWKDQLPAMKVGDDLIGFFRSVKEEAEPVEYSLINSAQLALQPSELGKNDLEKIPASIDALAKFKILIEDSPSEARKIFDDWRDVAIPEVLLQFFRSSLAYDEAMASEIATTIDNELIRRGFNITLWLWQQLLESDVCKLRHGMLVSVFECAAGYGVELNQLSSVLDERQHECFHGNVSHLLADTKGDFFGLRSFDNCSPKFNDLMRRLLDLDLNIDKPNNKSQTARSIAEAVEVKHGIGESVFKKMVSSYELNAKLEEALPEKPSTKTKRKFKA